MDNQEQGPTLLHLHLPIFVLIQRKLEINLINVINFSDQPSGPNVAVEEVVHEISFSRADKGLGLSIAG